MDQIARRYAPLSRDHIPGFPNKIPKVDWSRNLPTFKDDGRKDAALHLVRFHMHIRKLKVDFPEDCLMKIFLATLEGKAQSWYESLPPAYIYCLKDFYAMFIERYKDSYPSLNLVQDYCKHAYSFIESLEKFYEDDNFMDEEIMEALYENPFQQHEENLVDTHQDDQEILQQNQDQQAEDGYMAKNVERENDISDLPTEDSSMQVSPMQIAECDNVRTAISDQHSDYNDQAYLVLKPIKESFAVEIINRVLDSDVHEQQDEIFVQVSDESPFNNSVIKDSLSALSYEDNYCSSRRKQKPLSPLFEEEIDQLLKGQATAQATIDLQCTHGQESVGESFSSFENDDSLVTSFIDQQTNNIFFHKDDKAVMFDDLEDCFLFKNDLDHEDEEYELERDNMPGFFMVKEPTTSTQMADAHTSPCIPIPWKSIALSDQNGESTCIFAAGSPNKIMLQDYQDPFGILLQALENINVSWFIIISFGFSGYFELPTSSSFRLLEISESRNLVCSHLLDWLHWKAHYT